MPVAAKGIGKAADMPGSVMGDGPHYRQDGGQYERDRTEGDRPGVVSGQQVVHEQATRESEKQHDERDDRRLQN